MKIVIKGRESEQSESMSSGTEFFFKETIKLQSSYLPYFGRLIAGHLVHHTTNGVVTVVVFLALKDQCQGTHTDITNSCKPPLAPPPRLN
jgi:hypothetical protein